jgi:hypothetical protein
MHLRALLVCGVASYELCVHGVLLSQLTAIVHSGRAGSHRGYPPVFVGVVRNELQTKEWANGANDCSRTARSAPPAPGPAGSF